MSSVILADWSAPIEINPVRVSHITTAPDATAYLCTQRKDLRDHEFLVHDPERGWGCTFKNGYTGKWRYKSALKDHIGWYAAHYWQDDLDRMHWWPDLPTMAEPFNLGGLDIQHAVTIFWLWLAQDPQACQPELAMLALKHPDHARLVTHFSTPEFAPA